MRRILITGVSLMLAASPALAADPIGEWLVANGHAKIKIENCGKGLWGVISWEQDPGGRDANNPDPSKRDRPTLGMPILLDMQPDESNQWTGHVYNAENGKTYDAHISLSSPDVLRIEGCVLGFLCGGENWTRVSSPTDTQTQAEAGGRAASPSRGGHTAAAGAGHAASPPRTTTPGRPAAGQPHRRGQAPTVVAASDVCSSVGTTGLSHERRLK